MDDKDIPEGEYTSIRAGVNNQGRTVKYCYAKRKSPRGFFVGWREIGNKSHYFQRDQVIKHRDLETLSKELNSRANLALAAMPPRNKAPKSLAKNASKNWKKPITGKGKKSR